MQVGSISQSNAVEKTSSDIGTPNEKRVPYCARNLHRDTDRFDRFHLDGLVYPAIQMPPFDEVAMAADGRRSAGPHSNTGWVNRIGVPAVSLPGGFYANGLPFGLEISTKRWKDGDLLGYAFAYEQATHHRHPPVLVEKR